MTRFSFALALLFCALLSVASPATKLASAQAYTDYSEDAILTWLLRPGTSAPTRPTAIYVALCTDDATPVEAGTGCTEPEWTDYSCQESTFGAPANGAGSTREVANTGAVEFGDPDEDVSLTHFAVYDASSCSGGANMLLFGSFSSTISVQAGVNDPVSFPIGTLKVQQD